MPDRNIPDELWRYFGKEPPGTPKSNVVPINGHSLDALNFDNDDDDRRRSYALAALLKECDTVACTPPNTARNHNLNAAKFNLARFINEGILSNAEVDSGLTSAARAAGLPDREIEQCLRGDRHQNDSAAKRGNKPAVPPAATYGHVFEVDPETLQPVTSDNGAEPQDATDYFARTVRQRALQIRIDDEARELYNDWQASALGQTIPDIINLHDFLAVPDVDAQYRINDLWPTGGNVLLAAQYKAGKTSLVANLLRSLADGQPFLGKFGTTPPQRITLFDDELDERMLRRWLRDQGIRNQSAITLASMKGRPGHLQHPERPLPRPLGRTSPRQ
jgi:hypothetical protein